MGVITDIQPDDRHPHRYRISVDGDACVSVHEEVLLKLRLKVGHSWDESRWQQLWQEEEKSRAYHRALRYLQRRTRTYKELTLYLRGAGFAEEIVRETAQKCQRLGFVNDSDVLEMALRYGINKGWGPHRLYHYLVQRGIERAEVQRALEGIPEEEWLDSAREAAQKKWPSPPKDPKGRQKVVRHLQYKGFPPGIIRAVLEELSRNPLS